MYVGTYIKLHCLEKYLAPTDSLPETVFGSFQAVNYILLCYMLLKNKLFFKKFSQCTNNKPLVTRVSLSTHCGSSNPLSEDDFDSPQANVALKMISTYCVSHCVPLILLLRSFLGAFKFLHYILCLN